MANTNQKAFASMMSDKIETVTLSLTLDTRKREESLPVAVRINENRTTMYYRTGLRCTLDEWDALCRATGRGASKKSALITIKDGQKDIYEKVKDTVSGLLDSDTFSFSNLKEKLTGRTKDNFNQVWVDVANSKKEGTKEAYMIAYRSFTKYMGEKVSFASINVEFIQKWEKKMKDDGISNTTIGMYFRACRVMVNECIKNGKIKRMQYPFGKVSEKKVVIKKGRSRKDEFIDVKTIKTLMSFVAPESWHKGYAEVVYEAINMWVFSYLGNGMNLADMAQIRYNEYYYQSGKTELKFIRKKTEDTSDEDIEVIAPIIPELQLILGKYGSDPELNALIFPQILDGAATPEAIRKQIAQVNANIRNRVQAACKILGIEKKISMTWARHSFATNLTSAGISERYISQAMGHSTRSVTQGYIGLFPPEKRMMFNKMLLE